MSKEQKRKENLPYTDKTLAPLRSVLGNSDYLITATRSHQVVLCKSTYFRNDYQLPDNAICVVIGKPGTSPSGQNDEYDEAIVILFSENPVTKIYVKTKEPQVTKPDKKHLVNRKNNTGRPKYDFYAVPPGEDAIKIIEQVTNFVQKHSFTSPSFPH
ncbi:MAG: hypothetical protein A3D24_02370 [Candidatus Blackburnbacteria bacterium RIFCSPHIGHO2_02_FULL_39_13]|uniref:Uncharacterized protein n=1 Tax=Candidatus Blackburnbacteria bacterium RIFCSPLOWO2_01_FULL_40_20 TaxID=1797519 RepID=A0A1G1VAV1_9BACT|nr:MAG: hypothetical protein A2694_02810 [Candidatus Blackburnbacteria bacterium RIFCSPHIGHO2_01_FULL_40_17]OGY09526.1 MAG: hypothetical protein A3D24_02370 [Candidatus Blackburnbacteria bacterium RIFCSPHIGHO2_02_FULL_39_13]OGY12540.1 MAG: hypothetical protein A3A77_01040 [Candidatus Blackburnbacteria bacterium RIFCSPLOWO2_01_FULL_40_20]OGY14780.1 MAG: hypothetical protein A3I52_02350 [Candidatus Blackburnbacteria bacterium RIFCSPLOWO2_02_FULL_40_10]HBL52049.1 hypothetical protein [Candidatus B